MLLCSHDFLSAASSDGICWASGGSRSGCAGRRQHGKSPDCCQQDSKCTNTTSHGATCLPLAQCTSRSRPACNLTPHLLIPLLLHGWLQIYGLPMGTHTRLPPAAHGPMLQRSRPAASTTQGRHAVAAGALRFQHPCCSRCLVSAGPAQTATAAAEAGRLVLLAAFQDRVCQSSARWHPCAPVLP